MLGFAMATFFSLLLAIALRGPFVRLMLVMVVCFAVYLGVAALIGARQLRRSGTTGRSVVLQNASAEPAFEEPEAAHAPVVQQQRSVLFPDPPPKSNEDDQIYFDDDIDLFEGLEEFGTGEFDEDFFEPIPGLTFEPLNLDSSVLGVDGDAGDRTLFGPRPTLEPEEEVDHVTVEPQVAPAAEYETEPVSAEDLFGELEVEDYWETDHAHNKELLAELGIEIPESVGSDNHDRSALQVDETIAAQLDQQTVDGSLIGEPVDGEAVAGEGRDEPRRSEPTFTAAPVQRQRPAKRNKARPIYIESQLDEGDEQAKAVND